MTALGLTTPHPGQRCKPHWYQRALTRLRSARQRRQDAAADRAFGDDAWADELHEMNTAGNAVQVPAHAVPPALAAQITYNACHPEGPAVTDGFNVPPAAVLPDAQDERWPHLAPAYTDDTQAFGLSITEAGQ